MKNWMDGPLKGYFTHRNLNDNIPSENVELIPFDITLTLNEDKEVDPVVLTDVVTRWLDDNFKESVAKLDNRYNYRSVYLQELSASQNLRRRTQSAYKITYEGRSFWGANRLVPTETTVAAMQLEFLLDREGLKDKLQGESRDSGLGLSVAEARADLNRDAKATTSVGDESLDVIIIVAIVIAVLAAVLLSFALFMAWRTGKHRKQNSYLEGSPHNTDTDDSRPEPSPPSEFTPSSTGQFPDSVISDDISSSLSAYYKSGMAGGYKANKNQPGALNDAASVSSMESYGYSLDGYASSIAN